jgi:hypothetical protein
MLITMTPFRKDGMISFLERTMEIFPWMYFAELPVPSASSLRADDWDAPGVEAKAALRDMICSVAGK